VDKYSYAVSNSAPPVTTEQAEQPGGGYLTSQTLYDSLGQVRETQAQTAGGGTDVTDTSYNSDGWKALVSDPYYTSGAPSGTLVAAASSSVPSQTGYAYDGDGRVIKQIAYALGSQTWETDTTYGGNYVTVVPPSGGTPQTTFTDGRALTTAIYQYHAGVPASPSDPAADYDQTSYAYTPARQLASVTDAASNTWSWTYDLLGNQLTATDPDSGKTTSTYDAASQLMTVTDARGKQVSYTYDGDGRKTAEYDTTGGALETTSDQLASWTWDTLANGKLTSSTAFWGGASYTEAVTGYDSLGLPSGTQTVIPAAQGALAGTYTQQDNYAPDGLLTSYTDSAAGGLPSETVTTGFDAAGEPNALTGAGSYVDSLSYTNLGEPLQYTMGSPDHPAYITDSYDAQTRRLTEQNTQTGTGQASVDDLHYAYDPVGNVTSEADTPAGDSSAADVQCFSYDYLGRLVQAWAQGSTGCAATPSASAEGGAAPYWDSYRYNTIGNLTGITATTPSGAATTTTDGYPAAGAARPHGVTSSSITGPSGTTSTSYGYDPSGHLTTVTGGPQSQALTWDDAGRLTQDTVTPSGGTAKNTSYIYDAGGTLLLAADPGTTTLYLPDEELSLTGGTVTGTRYYSLGGQVVAARTGATSLAYLAGDSQATDSVAIDAATLAVTRRYYDPYGNPRGTTPASFPAGQKGFVGGTTDTATGLTNLGAREYQPATGSFISPDPLLKPYDPQDLNAYVYAMGNPSTYSDPTGALVGGNGECGGSIQACNDATRHHLGDADPGAPRGSSPAPSDTPGSDGRRICNGYGCASISYWHHHPSDPSAHTRAPVTRPHNDPQRHCAVMSVHVGYCVDINGAGSGLWHWTKNNWPTIVGVGVGLVCTFVTRGEDKQSICDASVGDDAPDLTIDDTQFGKKIGKHARDFGLDPSDPAARQDLRDMIDNIFYNPDEVREGLWNPKGGGGTDYRFYRRGQDVVVTDSKNNFVTILKDGVNNGWFKRSKRLR
jgi:RHS repeat-associated protein